MTLKREVRSLLNKISPENEAQIFAQLVDVQIRSAEDLQLISSLIIDKALGDPFFSEVYVRCAESLCNAHTALPFHQDVDTKGSAGLEPELVAELEGRGAFKGFLVQCCNRVFREFFGSVHVLDDDIQEAAIEFDSATCEAALGKRHRARACMRFFGHLFLCEILCESMLMTFLERLLEPPKETGASWPPKAWIECACELLYTVGKDLCSSSAGTEIMKCLMRKLSRWKDLREDIGTSMTFLEVAREGKAADFVYPLRTRFMIQDTVDAHHKGWPDTMTEKQGDKATCVSPTIRKTGKPDLKKYTPRAFAANF